jgi:hypothetical protein
MGFGHIVLTEAIFMKKLLLLEFLLVIINKREICTKALTHENRFIWIVFCLEYIFSSVCL